MYSSYEPCIYPGVNIKYYINTNNCDGICNCSKMCSGKGDANGDGDCKKVTVAIFQSGKIISTGAQNYSQIKEAYLFMNRVLDDNYELIKREEFKLKKTDDIISNKKFYINKKNIKNYNIYKDLLNI